MHKSNNIHHTPSPGAAALHEHLIRTRRDHATAYEQHFLEDEQLMHELVLFKDKVKQNKTNT